MVQVNIATRTAALSPGATDPLSHFEGTYVTHYLPNLQGKKSASQGPELCIVNKGQSETLHCALLNVPLPLRIVVEQGLT